MSQLIRTTQRPFDAPFPVSDAEYASLLRQGLIYGTAAPAPPDPDDVEIATILDDETSQTYARLLAQLGAAVQAGGNPLSTALGAAFGSSNTALAANPETIIVGTITRDANGAATAAAVAWPDGSPGTYTATTLSTDFPGAVDAYTVTYGSPVTKTYTQPAVTRDASTGAVTARPAIVVS